MTELNFCVLGDGFASGVGDPSMQGWSNRLMMATVKELGMVRFYNLGVEGETSPMVAARVNELAPRFPKGQDNRLILAFGLHDTELVDGKPRVANQESLEALKQLILKTRPHFKMIMIGIPPVYEPQQNTRIKRLNGLHRELCQKARVPYIDIFSSLAEDVQYKRELAKGDKVFPADIGYQKVFELIWNDRAWWFN
ncbi:GDSL-type esterase/lipase family protein [Reinekea sp. G2M2-21]|uniref:GDSL-type esterase/lipase family protein n=1 Tax=Reinekea sp. G2M2-21 TaxID=2788942 RepID=UPI0018AA4E58|nr:GDSL-type esterase/lipase family protein [Reinekea sp. G2M2-21]